MSRGAKIKKGTVLCRIPKVHTRAFISHNFVEVVLQKSQFLHKSVNVFFRLVITKDKLTNFCGNCLEENDFMNTCAKISLVRVRGRL